METVVQLYIHPDFLRSYVLHKYIPFTNKIHENVFLHCCQGVLT